MSEAIPDALSLGDVTYLINHMFLPPKLPQSDDHDPAQEYMMINVIIVSLINFKSTLEPNCRAIVESALAMVISLRELRERGPASGIIREKNLEDALTNLCTIGTFYHISLIWCWFLLTESQVVPFRFTYEHKTAA